MLLVLAASKLGRWVVLLTTQAHAYQLAWWGDEVQLPAVFPLDSSLGTERCIAKVRRSIHISNAPSPTHAPNH